LTEASFPRQKWAPRAVDTITNELINSSGWEGKDEEEIGSGWIGNCEEERVGKG